MNRLVIIGNGFDMAHGLKTSYKDFITWYWDKRVDAFVGNTTKISEDCLCKLSINADADLSCWNVFMFENSGFRSPRRFLCRFQPFLWDNLTFNRDERLG